MKFLQANRIAPDGTPRSVASHLGLFCLPMSHKREVKILRKLAHAIYKDYVFSCKNFIERVLIFLIFLLKTLILTIY